MATISRGSSRVIQTKGLRARQCSHGSVDLSFGRVDNIQHTRRTKRMCVFLILMWRERCFFRSDLTCARLMVTPVVRLGCLKKLLVWS